jgi:hypothetical protein
MICIWSKSCFLEENNNVFAECLTNIYNFVASYTNITDKVDNKKKFYLSKLILYYNQTCYYLFKFLHNLFTKYN